MLGIALKKLYRIILNLFHDQFCQIMLYHH